MQRSPRVNKAVSSQNYEEFDDALMKKARELRWLFVKKGDTEPIVIGYNSVMWPKEMTTRQKVNLETKPSKTKVMLSYENKDIECSLSAVVPNSVLNNAMQFVHAKMLEGEGQLSDVSYHGNAISPSPARFEVKRKHTGGNEAKKAKKSLKFAGTTCVSEEPSVSLNIPCIEETSQNHENSNDVSPISERFVATVEREIGELVALHEEHARKLTKENNSFRLRFTELMKRSKGETLVSKPLENSEPLMFGDFDLMTLTPVGGPQTFGRLLAATLFGAEGKCELMASRMGIKVSKNNCREPAERKKEELFKECVARFYPQESEKAIRFAMRGANQYGTDMKMRFAKRDENNENDQL